MIVVHGATGFTGNLVCWELQARGVEFVIAGRNLQKLEQLAAELGAGDGDPPEVRLVSQLTPEALDDAFDDSEVVINCAGPFVDLGRPVVDAAVRNGAHYLDTTGEQGFIATCARELDGPARDAGVVVSPACAFEFATGDCAAALLAEHGVRHLTVFYATTDASTSRGTKKSIVRILEQKGVGLEDGELVTRAAASEAYEVELGGRRRSAVWFAGGEPFSVRRHHADVRTANSALVVPAGAARALRLASGAIPSVTHLLRPLLDRAIEFTDPDPHAASDVTARFVVKAVDVEHEGSWVALRGSDPYQFTARVIAEAARRLLVEGVDAAGYAPVARCFAPAELMESVGIRVEDSIADT